MVDEVSAATSSGDQETIERSELGEPDHAGFTDAGAGTHICDRCVGRVGAQPLRFGTREAADERPRHADAEVSACLNPGNWFVWSLCMLNLILFGYAFELKGCARAVDVQREQWDA